MMRDALLHGLSLLPNVEVITTHDARLTPPLLGSVTITAQDDALFVWQNLLQDCDAAFIIAPETGHQLADLVALVNRCQVLHLGSSLSAIKVATSKYQTSQQLIKAGLNAIPTYYLSELEVKDDDESRAWVVKPDDGAGCDGTMCFRKWADVKPYVIQQTGIQVIQPYIEGIAASISMLCKNGKAWVLSCNLQKIELVDTQFIYRGSVVNGFSANYARFENVATHIAQAMPELAGYVGVDVIVNKSEITILEINPRLTTSFVGLHQSLGINPSKLILDLFFDPQFTMPELLELNKLNNMPVEITI